MKTRNAAAFRVTEDDIRAYAAHLHERNGRLPGRDLDNWLEAESCLRANVRPGRSARVRPRHRDRERHGFTMPACDSSLWIEQAGCVGTAAPPNPSSAAVSGSESVVADQPSAAPNA